MDKDLGVDIPEFDEQAYLAGNDDARQALAAGRVSSGYHHYLTTGFDELREPRLRRKPLALQGGVERFLVSESGYFLIAGWMADEGSEPLALRIVGDGFSLDVPSGSVLRQARFDLEGRGRQPGYDYGFLAFGVTLPRSILKQPLGVQLNSTTCAFEAERAPELMSDKRLMDTLLIAAATGHAHAGKEAGLRGFLDGAAGAALEALFAQHVARATADHHVQRFRPRAVARSFVTVLFGSSDAIAMQPVLFREAGIDVGEWIYVCNSPEDAGAVLRTSRLMSDLYDMSITAIIMSDNVGFAAANNLAISHAASDTIVVINPDVFPVPDYAANLRASLMSDRRLGKTLWGGPLFYDSQTLMHAGMYLEKDLHFAASATRAATGRSAPVGLLRTEHFDKGVPFDEARWSRPVAVPAVTGAVMAFDRPCFQRLGGFSTRYIYGHYEDADLSLRWRREIGPVAIDPDLRLIHLEGQGSRIRGEQYGAAAAINRHVFSRLHESAFDQDERILSRAHDLAAP